MKRPYRLSAAFVRSVKDPGVFGDGRGGSGLALRVHRTKSGDVSKSWRQRVRIAGRVASLGLGSWPFVSLEAARKQAIINKGQALSGIDPRTGATAIAASPAPVASAPVPASTAAPTFEDAFEATIRQHREGWSTQATENRWRRSIRDLVFLDKPVNTITSPDVYAAVSPDWLRQPYAAKSRLAAIRATMKWAIGAGHRSDDPTKRARDQLPRQRKKTRHFAAVSVSDAPAAFARLGTFTRSRRLTRLSIQFQMLTATRPSEARGARWDQIDGDVWTIPAEQLGRKTGRAHRVPLSAPALAVIAEAARETGKRSGLIFPSNKRSVIQGSATITCMKACFRGQPFEVDHNGKRATPHGFRSTFRVWCAETGVPREVAEACLAHVVGGVEGSYQRSTMLERRREIMERWARHIA